MLDPKIPIIIGDFKGVVDNTVDLMLGASIARNNNNVVTDEYSGVLTKEYGFSYTGELGSTLVVDACNAIGGWVDDGGTSSSVAVNSTCIIGSNCIGAAVTADFITGLVAHNVLTPVDLSGYTKIGFYVMSTVTLNAGDYQFLTDESSDCASPDETLNIPALTANRWEYVVLTFAAATTLRNAVAAIGIKCAVDKGACTVYIDQVTAISTTTSATAIKTIANYKKADGSEVLMAYANGEIYTSSDGATWTLIASGLSTTYDVEFTTFEGDYYWMNGSDYCMRYTSAGLVIVYAATSGSAYYMPKGRQGWVHQDAIFAMIYATDPVTVRWNDPAKTPDEADWFPSTRNKDLAESTGDYLTKGIKYGDRSVIFMNNTFFVLSGTDSSDFDWMPREFGIGCTMSRSVQVKDGVVIFANENGIYKMDESFVPLKISESIKNKYSNFIQPGITSTYWTQTLEADWNAGTRGSYQFDTSTTSGKIYQLPQTSQSDWSAGAIVNADITTTAGDVGVTNRGELSGTTPFIAYDAHTSTNRIAQSLTPATNVLLYSFYPLLITTFSGTGNVYVSLYADGSGSPSGSAISTVTTDVGSISYPYNNFVFTDPISLTASTTYHIVIYTDSGVTTGQIHTTLTTGSSFTGSLSYSTNSGSTWTAVSTRGIRGAINFSASLITRTIDKGSIPASLGSLTANVTVPSGCSVEFLAQTDSADTFAGSYTSLGTATASGSYSVSLSTLTARRYIKIKAFLNCNANDGLEPTIHLIYIGCTYISQSHDTSGSILQWGVYDVTQTLNNQVINHYIRTATTEGGLTSASWTAIQPGNLITELTTNSWVQFKLEFDTSDYTQIPNVDLVTINWITSTQSTVPTTQFASIVHNNRYYLFGTLTGSTSNNDGIVIDKNWNFQFLNTYPVGCLTMFKEQPYFGDAALKSVYRFLTGNRLTYKATTAAITSYWDTGRFGLETKGQDKWFKELILFFEPETTTTNLVIYYDVNNSGTWTSLGTIDLNQGDGEERILFTGYIYGRDIRFRFYNSAENVSFKLLKCEVLYSIKARTY